MNPGFRERIAERGNSSESIRPCVREPRGRGEAEKNAGFAPPSEGAQRALESSHEVGVNKKVSKMGNGETRKSFSELFARYRKFKTSAEADISAAS